MGKNQERKHGCFLCPKMADRNHDVRILSDDVVESPNSQLQIIFLLQNVFNMPSSLCCKYLKEQGNPTEWGISFCRKCKSRVEQVFHAHQELRAHMKAYNILVDTLRSDFQIHAENDAKFLAKHFPQKSAYTIFSNIIKGKTGRLFVWLVLLENPFN